tara:strand:- start:357 stop:692 length:336 start_codon:yes stop_codon:yes gene_type:complete
MAYFAEINGDNIVTRVVVVPDEHDNEEGCDWCEEFFGGGTWVRTAIDGSIRVNYAGPGYSYDEVNDVFVEPKPFPSWALDSDTFQWEPPTSHPNAGTPVYWDEDTLAWVEM